MATQHRLHRSHTGLWCVVAMLTFTVSATDAAAIPPENESDQPVATPASQPENKTAAQKLRKARERREARKAARQAKAATTTPAEENKPAVATPEPAEKTDTPQVEVYIPSVATLRSAADRSKTAEIYRALAGMFPIRPDDTGEGLDVAAAFKLVEQITNWPDTSVVLTVYSMDREGRPRWALRVDWPLEELRTRIAELLESEAAHELLKDIKLTEGDEGKWRLELPDYELAMLSRTGEGSLVASTIDLKPPAAVFGQEGFGKKEGSDQAAKKPKKPMLVYSRLNLEADQEERRSPFAMISGVRDICYGISLDKTGAWNEKLVIRWSPLLGTALKMAFRTIDKPFECPRRFFAIAAFNLGMGEGLADQIAGLPPGTIRSRASSEVAFAAVHGTGFLPFPDLYFQFYAPKKDKIIESLREAIAEDAKKRKENEERPAWREEKADDDVIFWRDPAADGGANLMPARYRTVLFFDTPEEEGARSRLIIAQTSTGAADAVRRWKDLTKGKKSRITIPDSTKTHWQARVNWRSVYALAQPYLCLLSSLEEGASLPPPEGELADVLTDSVLNIRIDYAGLDVRHAGPIPLGAAYVPAIVAMTLSDSGSPWSEAGREKIACQHLRTLYYHAKLFKKDFGRWPATVAELDGYVDFASHSELLWMWPQDQSLAQRFASAFTAKKPKALEKEDGEIDDSLYQIDWTPADWKLKFREGEFKGFATIYIDTDGTIHRVPKPATSQPAGTGGESTHQEKETDRGTGR